MEIEVKNLAKKVGGKYILKDISISFDSGKVHLIIGPNGAGKTTLLKLLSLLDSPSAGEIFYDGFSVHTLSTTVRTNVRRKMGVLLQNPVILSGDVYENAVSGLRYRGIKIVKEEVIAALTRFGLLKKIDQNAKKLSGGEKQRLSFVRIWLLNPDVYILDEPTSHLDPISQKIIEYSLFELISMKKTLIIATHNLRDVHRYNGRVFFIKNGRLIQSGSAEDVFEHPSDIEIAQYTLAENIISGEVVDELGQKYLLAGDLKISVVTQEIIGPAVGVLKAEEIFLSKEVLHSSARNCFKGIVKAIEKVGSIYNVTVDCSGMFFETVITKQSLNDMELKVGSVVYITFKATSVHLIKNSQ